nr:MAG TPA: hypothetical protein [Caudoviricetes sp.]
MTFLSNSHQRTPERNCRCCNSVFYISLHYLTLFNNIWHLFTVKYSLKELSVYLAALFVVNMSYPCRFYILFL